MLHTWGFILLVPRERERERGMAWGEKRKSSEKANQLCKKNPHIKNRPTILP
jgi:hypothetical protein